MCDYVLMCMSRGGNCCLIGVGMRYVRGAEIIEIRDEEGVVLNDFMR